MTAKISPIQRALNLWAVILIIWSIYRANLKLPEWFDEFIAKPLVFILPVYYYIQHIEKSKFIEGLWIKPKKLLNDILLGLGIGGIFFITSILANSVKFKKIFFLNASFDFNSFSIILITALATGISEEILSRGFILKRLYEDSKNTFTSIFFASILFFFLHIPMLFANVKITGNVLLLFMATDLILSLVNSYLFLDRKSLVLPILIHAFYNAALIMFV